MKHIDTHVHFLISKLARPDWEDLSFLVEVARTDGIDLLCVSEHRDSVHYEELVIGIFEELRLGGEVQATGVVRLESGLVLSSAAEVALKGGGDVGVHCCPRKLLSLNKEKGAYSLEELLGAVSDVDEASVVAHHYYWPNKSFAEIDRLARRLDALELPAKDLANSARYEALAERCELPLIGASDAHTWVQVGSCRSVVQVDDLDAYDHSVLKSWFSDGCLRAVPMDHASERVRISKLLRNRMESRAAA
jgi:hypothetical protein